MNKKRILIWTAIVILFGFLVFVFRSREMNHLLDLDSLNIEKVEVIDLGVSCTVTEEDDIEEVLQPFQEIHVRKKILNNKDQGGITIIITYKNGKVVELFLLGGQVVVNNHVYSVDKNHVNTYQKLIEKYKVK